MKLGKKTKARANFYTSAGLIFGILAVLNFFSYQIFFRWDLTENNDYSISSVSERAVSELDDIVNIKVYFSENLPGQYMGLRQEVGDILDEYASYANGKIKVEFIDPGNDEEKAQEATMFGIPKLQFNVMEKDKYQVMEGYLGMIVQYGENTEVIPVIEDTRNLEYQTTLSIKKAMGEVDAVIGFVSSHGTRDLEGEMSVAYGKIKELYQVKEVNLNVENEVPSDVNTLVIVGPKEVFQEESLRAIDNFLMRGGSLLILSDGVRVGENLTATRNNTGLESLLEKYGVKLNHDLVLDVSSGMASFNQGFITFSTSYPFWPKIIKGGFDTDSAITSKLESLVLPWSSSLDITENNIDKGNEISYLAKTTKKSWIENSDTFDLNPQQSFVSTNGQGEKNMAILISGKFRSAFGENTTDSGKLAVAGDSDFATDIFTRRDEGNLVFFQNLVDVLSLDDDLVNIRSGGISNRPIKDLSDGARAAVRYLNVFGLTVVIVFLGLLRYFLRKKSGFADEL